MRFSSLFILSGTFLVAAATSIVAAYFSVALIEESSKRSVLAELRKEGIVWTEVHAEGLQVFITGVAPDEAARFSALSTAGSIVDAARLIDNMQVEASADIAPPHFLLEVLRNESGISLIGLVPRESDRTDILRRLGRLGEPEDITDLMEAALYPAPEGWGMALDYGLEALTRLERAKISVSAGRVKITAISESVQEQIRLEQQLLRDAPAGLELNLSITSPRPVITPFTTRFLIDENGAARFDACSADTEKSRARILTAARSAGLEGEGDCVIGMGVPSPSWADAVEIAIAGLQEVGGGAVTIADADVRLVALEGTDPALFDRIMGEIEADLPEVFALEATLPVTVVGGEATLSQEFMATLSPEGLVQLRGRLLDERSRATLTSYAGARFGTEQIYMAARLDETLPADWGLRVAVGLDALAMLTNGVLTVTAEDIFITGKTGNAEANAEISRLLTEKLAGSARYNIDVTYVEILDPVALLPTPEECAESVTAILLERKISFEPGSGDLDPSAAPIIDDIAEVLRECQGVKMEIQGHTDSQGREEMNLALSQTRATSVLNALADRRLLTSALTAQGYGEATPIADNDTEEGREANRRIEFVLVSEEEPPKPATPQGEAAANEGATQTEAEEADGQDAANEGVIQEESEATTPAPEAETASATASEDDTGGSDAPEESPTEDSQDSSGTQAKTPTEEPANDAD